MPDYAAHEAVYFSQAITADDFAMKKNPKYVNKVVAPTLEPISSIGGFRTLPDYSFDTMPDDYVALVLIGGFGWNTPVAEKVMPIIKSAIEQEKVIGAICNAASFMAKCGIDRETTSKTLQKSSVIQKISVTLSSVIIAIIVCKLLIFNTLRLQQFFANHHFSGTYISSQRWYLYVAGTMLRAGKLQDLTGRVAPHVTAAYWARTTEPMVPTPSFSILLTATFYSTLLPDQSA